MIRLVNPTSSDMRHHQRMKFTFILIIGFIVILSTVSVTTSNANSKDKPLYWRQVDKKGDVVKMCDNKNLIYKINSAGARGRAIFVIEGGCR